PRLAVPLRDVVRAGQRGSSCGASVAGKPAAGSVCPHAARRVPGGGVDMQWCRRSLFLHRDGGRTSAARSERCSSPL
ncbi:MAG: hypothetical protein ACK58T_45740, partial [Phycisphaerae bacterium]